MAKILVIEDEHSLRRDIIDMLSFEGHEVSGAENGVAGVQEALRLIPDLIICDIMMPELDGYGVLDALRGDEAAAAIPFIFLTARTDKSDLRSGMNRGADDYLTKPFAFKELLRSVNARLRRRRDIERTAERQLDALRDNIILALPHELRTPLTVILGFSDILNIDCETLPPTRIREISDHINTAAHRLYHMVENYLVYAQIELIVADAADLAALLDHRTPSPQTLLEGQAAQRAQFYAREADLKLDVQPAGAVQMLADYFQKAVSEVIDNAFKFSAPGAEVRVSAAARGKRYVIAVRDSGRGMTADEIGQVGAYMQFNRHFYEQQGSGLGLIIARRLAELHAGGLEISSARGAGTTVTLSLPLAP